MRFILALMMAAALYAGNSRAWAQDEATKATARQLFDEGRKLMAQERYEEALARFQASLDLDPASGTHGNLAFCYQKLGKLATAWGHYREAAARAEHEGNTEHARAARKLAAELEPRLPRLLIRLQSGVGVAGLLVRRNGIPVPAAALGKAVYVDPGDHVVIAAAPGRVAFSTTATVAESKERTIEIPLLARTPKPHAHTSARPTGNARRIGPPRLNVETSRDEVGQPRRITSWIIGGTGLVTTAVGFGFGITAKSAWDVAFESGACNPQTLLCTPDGQKQTDTARSRAQLSNILIGTGIVAIATGVVVYFTTPNAAHEKAATRLVPLTGVDTLGVAVAGGF
jgi:hypothetical protein